ncbi:transaldolase family protein [Streptomyces sp. NPDC058239]|uniref:transaldolase family protein n=1 Tax=unclassified Streptomyces TaxID=2593676 RepID=UPI00365A0060
MNVTQALHEQGQSIWLDSITRSMLDTGQIQHYIDQYSVTGFTSNPSIFDKAIGSALPSDGGESEAMLARFASAGVDVKALAATLQSEGAKSFVAAWSDLMERIDVQSKAVA